MSLKNDIEKKKRFNLINKKRRKHVVLKETNKHQQLEYYHNNYDIIKQKKHKLYKENRGKKTKKVSLNLEWDFDNPCDK
jgi:hypothetical protein